MKPKCIFFILLFLILTNSCQKEAGEGGTSSIIGRLKAQKYMYNGTKYVPSGEEYYLSDERVYIIYGDDSIYSDDFRTDPDGCYRFQWLRKGKYTIFTYSKDTTSYPPPGDGWCSVEVTVEIEKNKKEYTAPELNVVRILL